MIYKVIISKEASKDLKEIRMYIAYALHEPVIAKKTYDLIKENILLLKDNPIIFAEEKDARIIKANIRKKIVKNYLIFYKIIEEKSLVQVLRVLHSRRN
jgi:toxin ParE1/3/4